MIGRVIGIIALALALAPHPAQAAAIETEIVHGELIAEHASVAPGDQTYVALTMSFEPGWHTYWKNPGDSGQPIEVRWNAPDDVVIGDIEWPAPHRQPYDPLLNYGYKDAATLLIPVEIPPDWPLGEPLVMKAQVYWLVCNEVCIPDRGEATVSLTIGSSTEKDPSVAGIFTDARAALPQRNPYSATFELNDNQLRLRFDGGAFAAAAIEDVYFYPDEQDLIDHAASQRWAIDPAGLTIGIPLGVDVAERGDAPISGVLEIVEKGPTEVLRLALGVEAAKGAVPVALDGSWASIGGGVTWPAAIGLAFLGGVILNLMPCVFPILALKTLGVARSTGLPRLQRVAHGFAYMAGILVFFGALGGAYLALKSAGATIGWGYQLQNPLIVALLAFVMFVVGLSLSGVFHVGSQFSGIGSNASASAGTRGAFFTGALAAVVATPCTAPFMATAMGATLTMSGPETLSVFAALGLGLAAPFFVLSLLPGATRWLPAPGVWMLRLQQSLAFPMYATAAWLLWVLGAQAGPDAVFAVTIGAVLLGFGAWAFGVGQMSGSRGRRVGYGAAIASIAGALALTTLIADPTGGSNAEAAVPADDISEPFSTERLAALRAEGKPVFVNMTADWCITCKVNERVAFGPAFEAALAEHGITYLKGDWTKRNPEITAFLARFGRVGVPLYAVFPREGEPVLLPQILTSATVVDALGRV